MYELKVIKKLIWIYNLISPLVVSEILYYQVLLCLTLQALHSAIKI